MERKCAFKFVYQIAPHDYYLSQSVAETRLNLGRLLAKSIPDEIVKEIDYVCPVPNTGTYYAMGLAEAIKKPYLVGIIKSTIEERSFGITSVSERKQFLWNKLHVIPELVKGKNLAIVDEAIFTGATLKIACEMLRQEGVNKIYLCIPTPQCRNHCEYGIQPKRKMLLEYLSENMLPEYFDVDGIFFQDEKNFESIAGMFGNDICCECFLGRR